MARLADPRAPVIVFREIQDQLGARPRALPENEQDQLLAIARQVFEDRWPILLLTSRNVVPAFSGLDYLMTVHVGSFDAFLGRYLVSNCSELLPEKITTVDVSDAFGSENHEMWTSGGFCNFSLAFFESYLIEAAVWNLRSAGESITLDNLAKSLVGTIRELRDTRAASDIGTPAVAGIHGISLGSDKSLKLDERCQLSSYRSGDWHYLGVVGQAPCILSVKVPTRIFAVEAFGLQDDQHDRLRDRWQPQAGLDNEFINSQLSRLQMALIILSVEQTIDNDEIELIRPTVSVVASSVPGQLFKVRRVYSSALVENIGEVRRLDSREKERLKEWFSLISEDFLEEHRLIVNRILDAASPSRNQQDRIVDLAVALEIGYPQARTGLDVATSVCEIFTGETPVKGRTVGTNVDATARNFYELRNIVMHRLGRAENMLPNDFQLRRSVDQYLIFVVWWLTFKLLKVTSARIDTVLHNVNSLECWLDRQFHEEIMDRWERERHKENQKAKKNQPSDR